MTTPDAPSALPSGHRRDAFQREHLPDPAAYFEGQGLKLKGRGKWRTTQCVLHGGSDSLRINTDSGAWVCMSCGEKGGDVLAYEMRVSGADFVTAAIKLGAWAPGAKVSTVPRPQALSPRDALSVIVQELGVVWVVVHDIANGVVPSPKDWARFNAATGRIEWLAMEFK